MYIPVQKGLYFGADAGPARVELNAQSHNSQHPRHLKQPLSNVERDVGGGKGDGYFHQCIVEHMREPEDGDLGHEVAKCRATECHFHKVEENLQCCNLQE